MGFFDDSPDKTGLNLFDRRGFEEGLDQSQRRRYFIFKLAVVIMMLILLVVGLARRFLL